MIGFETFKKIEDLIKDLHSGHVTVNVSVPSMLVHAEVDVVAPGIKEALNLGYHLAVTKLQK